MAKEQLNVWMKFALWAIGLVFAAGMSYDNINRISCQAEENRKEIKEVSEDVHRLELNVAQQTALMQGNRDMLKKQGDTIESIREYLMNWEVDKE